FQFEGAKRMRKAKDGVDALQKVVDTLIIIPNQNLFRLANEKTTFTEAFSLADDVLYQGVKGVTDLMVRPGLINLDFADVRAVMDEMGKAMMGTGEAEGENRAIEAAEMAIANPLLDEISLRGAKGVLINITGAHDLTLFELDEAANRIREEVDPEANIIVGSTLDPDMEGAMRVSVVATGIDAVDIQTDMPIPRRPLAAPLKRTVSVEEAHAQPVDLVEPVAAQTEVARGYDQTQFPGMDVEEVAAADLAEDIFESTETETAEDGLPSPVYQPKVPAFEPHVETLEADPEMFVAPQARAPGTPSPEAMVRLQTAAQKAAPAPQQGSAPAPAPVAAVVADKPRFGINSFITRMTGQASDTPAAPKPQPTVYSAQAQQRDVAAEPQQENDAEQDRIEIPAFLRRQAN
ncbi:MAG: cell division protein FtsZ, partial [Rhodobacteraceae bacterium]|nr:cell division protein FtsZ [Paracoccaceae bacterium]